jgi:hypothetical protein
MKLITATLLSALSCYTELAAAATGRVITLDPSLSSHEHASTQQDTLSPETARLVIAQRAGLEDYHVEKALNEKEINAINAHGLQTSRLSKDNTERVFILAFVDEEDADGMSGQCFHAMRYGHILTYNYSSCSKSTLFRCVARSLSTRDQVLLRRPVLPGR